MVAARRPSSAVATSREGHRSPRSDPEGQHRRQDATFQGDSLARANEEAAARLAAAVAELPSERGFADVSSWLVEGCRTAQPLEPLMGSRIGEPMPPVPGALVSVQATFDVDGRPMLIGAPALLGRRGEAASLLAQPC